MKRGFLLMNTGSPDAPSEEAVRRYLGEFLMDPYVIDLPWILRTLLVKGIILRTRPAQSAEAYAEIWTGNGSPLIHYCRKLVDGLKPKFDAPVEMIMAYGNPSVSHGVGKLLDAGVDEVCLLPMFPQYAMATVGSCVAGVQSELKRRKSMARLRVAPPFYVEPTYIEPIAASLADVDEHLLFSYHGLPERHLKKTDPTGKHCLSTPDCCETASPAHATCYRHQCMETTKAIAAAAGLPEERYTVAFQSRLGRDKWLEPATDRMLEELPAKGIKHLAVLCPAFFCDCLETLEEIEMRGKETFMEAGGESFRMIPCLNDSAAGLHCLETLLASADNWPVPGPT
jgi:ferrochelatase